MELSITFPQFRKIWIQRSKYSLCLTLFDYNGGYRILTSKNIYHGFSQKTTIEEVNSLIQSIVLKDQ